MVCACVLVQVHLCQHTPGGHRTVLGVGPDLPLFEAEAFICHSIKQAVDRQALGSPLLPASHSPVSVRTTDIGYLALRGIWLLEFRSEALCGRSLPTDNVLLVYGYQ